MFKKILSKVKTMRHKKKVGIAGTTLVIVLLYSFGIIDEGMFLLLSNI